MTTLGIILGEILDRGDELQRRADAIEEQAHRFVDALPECLRAEAHQKFAEAVARLRAALSASTSEQVDHVVYAGLNPDHN